MPGRRTRRITRVNTKVPTILSSNCPAFEILYQWLTVAPSDLSPRVEDSEQNVKMLIVSSATFEFAMPSRWRNEYETVDILSGRSCNTGRHARRYVACAGARGRASRLPSRSRRFLSRSISRISLKVRCLGPRSWLRNSVPKSSCSMQ